jgi:hypothetical protein
VTDERALTLSLIRSAPATIAQAWAAGDFEGARTVYAVTNSAINGDLAPFRALCAQARELGLDLDPTATVLH